MDVVSEIVCTQIAIVEALACVWLVRKQNVFVKSVLLCHALLDVEFINYFIQ